MYQQGDNVWYLSTVHGWWPASIISCTDCLRDDRLFRLYQVRLFSLDERLFAEEHFLKPFHSHSKLITKDRALKRAKRRAYQYIRRRRVSDMRRRNRDDGREDLPEESPSDCGEGQTDLTLAKLTPITNCSEVGGQRSSTCLSFRLTKQSLDAETTHPTTVTLNQVEESKTIRQPAQIASMDNLRFVLRLRNGSIELTQLCGD